MSQCPGDIHRVESNKGTLCILLINHFSIKEDLKPAAVFSILSMWRSSELGLVCVITPFYVVVNYF